MGRVEETNKASTELENTLANCINNTTDTSAAIAMILTAQCSVNTEIAKSLAQLADDINFIKEAMAKKMEEESKPSGPKCMDCVYSDVMNYVDTDGVVNRNVEWCHRKSQRINFDDRPDCDYFKPREAES